MLVASVKSSANTSRNALLKMWRVRSAFARFWKYRPRARPYSALMLVRRTGELARFPFPAHPHMLRHGCGFKLATGAAVITLVVWLGSVHRMGMPLASRRGSV